MSFLATIIILCLLAESAEHFIIPIIALLIRGFYKNGRLVISAGPAVVAIATLLLMPTMMILFGGKTFQQAISEWTVLRLSMTVFVVMICIQNFYSEYIDNPWIPRPLQALLYHLVRAFTVLKTQGEEASYTVTAYYKRIRRRSFIYSVPAAVTTYLTQVVGYVDNRALVMDCRGGFPPMRLWRRFAYRKLDYLGDFALILFIVFMSLLGHDRLVPSSIVSLLSKAASFVFP